MVEVIPIIEVPEKELTAVRNQQASKNIEKSGTIPDGSDFISPKQLATRLSMSLKWVEKQTQARRMPGQVKMGRVWRYHWVEVQKRMLTGQLLLEPIRLHSRKSQ
jgi:hypothetical protein